MKKVLAFSAVAVVLAGMIFFSVRQAVRKGTRVYEEEAKTVATLVSSVKASGEIQPRVYVNISSQVPGQIVELRVKEGDQVRKGDVLLQLDPEQYRSTVTRLEANLRLSRINLDRERNSLKTHEATLSRHEALARSEIVSAEALDQARLMRDTSLIQIRAYEEQISQAEADLFKAKDELAKTTIRAPIDGLVTRVAAKLGEQVIIGTMNNPGTVILVLSDMSEMLAEVRVDETEVSGVKAGQKAVVTVDAVEDHKFEGAVSEIAHTATKDGDVSRFTVKIALSGAAFTAALRPGMSAHAAIQVASRDGVVVVPLQAVVSRKRKEVEEALKASAAAPSKKKEETGSIAAEPATAEAGGARTAERKEETPSEKDEVDVIFVDRGGKAEMIQVKTGLSDEFTVELIGAPISAGEKVVIGPYRTLKKLKPAAAITKAEKDEDLKEKE
ncbi:MAG TPA: efflux RND transporter periplasmic adaptor subunit [Candidatus Polarisedimenticolia bacterium]|jgi:HlyD family secretion protein